MRLSFREKVLKIREIERIKVVADYFSSLATTVGSFVFLGLAASLVSSGKDLTIQGVKVDTKNLYSFSAIAFICSILLLSIAYLFLSSLDEQEN
jgi:uncharacterized BrkB/YihY/UPF0761 family membrane protein